MLRFILTCFGESIALSGILAAIFVLGGLL